MKGCARIERLIPGDESSVRKLLSDAQLPVGDLSAAKLDHFLVARAQSGEAVGAIGLEPLQGVGLLRSLVVHPSWRGRGLGHDLTRRMEAYAREAGVRTLFLLTVTAEGFFPRLGYRVVGREEVPEAIAATKEFQDICPVSAVCLSKDL